MKFDGDGPDVSKETVKKADTVDTSDVKAELEAKFKREIKQRETALNKAEKELEKLRNENLGITNEFDKVKSKFTEYEAKLEQYKERENKERESIIEQLGERGEKFANLDNEQLKEILAMQKDTERVTSPGVDNNTNDFYNNENRRTTDAESMAKKLRNVDYITVEANGNV